MFLLEKKPINDRTSNKKIGKKTNIFGKKTNIFGKKTNIFGKKTNIIEKYIRLNLYYYIIW